MKEKLETTEQMKRRAHGEEILMEEGISLEEYEKSRNFSPSGKTPLIKENTLKWGATSFKDLLQEQKKNALERCKNLEYIPYDVFLHELTTAITKGYELALEEVEKGIYKRMTVTSKEESFRRSDKATEWGYDVATKDVLTHIAQLKETK